MTENSPTSLVVTFDGSSSGITVTPVVGVGGESWDVTLPYIQSVAAGNWIEPENSSQFNNVSANGTNQLVVVSDSAVTVGQLSTPVADGTTIGFGSDANNESEVLATFHDLASTTEVPEPSTLALLALSLIFLVAAIRFRLRRTA